VKRKHVAFMRSEMKRWKKLANAFIVLKGEIEVRKRIEMLLMNVGEE
jgi:hypothetical protein